MGGFILGGGYGLQSRMYGLAIDNLVGMQVVLTNGQTTHVVEGDDLFWALRGSGGGNIGVVTSFDYKVYPSSDIKLEASVEVTLGELIGFLRRLGAIESGLRPEFTLAVHGYRAPGNQTAPEFLQRIPDQSSASHQDLQTNDEEGHVKVSLYWMGDANPEIQEGMKYLKDSIVPLFASNATMDKVIYYYFSWSGMSRQREQDDTWKSVYSAQSWNGFLLDNNNTEEVWKDIESSLTAMFYYCKFVSPRVELWGGAISKVAPNATAFPYRNALYRVGVELLVPKESDADAANDEIHLVNAIWPSIARHLDGVYINNPMPSLSREEYAAAYWGSNLERLKQLKQKYDPIHALTYSQSIPIVINASASTR